MTPARPRLAPDQGYEWQSALEHPHTAWARACYHNKQLFVWAHTRRPAALLIELQALSGLPSEQIHLHDTADNQADAYDCAMDAALMAFGRPQAVQVRASQSETSIRLSVYQGAAEPNDLTAHLQACRWQLNTLSGVRPSLAAILCGQQGLPSSGLAVQSDYFSAPFLIVMALPPAVTPTVWPRPPSLPKSHSSIRPATSWDWTPWRHDWSMSAARKGANCCNALRNSRIGPDPCRLTRGQYAKVAGWPTVILWNTSLDRQPVSSGQRGL